MRRPFLLAVGLLLLGGGAEARRAPGPGGQLTIYAPGDAAQALADSLENGPLVEPRDLPLSASARAAWPALDGQEARSRYLLELRRASETAWILVPRPGAALRGPLADCLRPEGRWPGRALAAAGVEVRVDDGAGEVTLRFDAPTGAAVSLLRGCTGDAGAFRRSGDRWLPRDDAPRGRPHLDGIRLVPEATDASLLLTDAPAEGELLVAPWPDVWLLLPDTAARDADPFGLGEDAEGLARFGEDLSADLIVAVARGGRGSGTSTILPPGVAPSRPSLRALDPEPGRRLTLDPLPSDAPTIALIRRGADDLAARLAERLSLLLRARGWATIDAGAGRPSALITRWRPPTDDPALALLVLAAEHALEVPADLRVDLLSDDGARRVGAALTLERRWIEGGLVVPLLTASRTATVSPRLRGVRLRGDGAPVLDDAWWTRP